MNFFLDIFYPEKRRREKESREREQREERTQAQQCRLEAEQLKPVRQPKSVKQTKQVQRKVSTAAARQAQHDQQSYLFNNNLYVHGGDHYNSDGMIAYGISKRRGGSGRHAPNRLASHAYYPGYSSGAESMAAGTLPGSVPGYASEGYTYINRRVHPAYYGIAYDASGYSSSGGSYAPPPRIKLKRGARRSRRINPVAYPDGAVSKTSVGRTNPSFSDVEGGSNKKASISTLGTLSGEGGGTRRSRSGDGRDTLRSRSGDMRGASRSRCGEGEATIRVRSRRRGDEEGSHRSGDTTDTASGRPRQGSGTSFPGMFGRTRSRTLVFPFRRERGSFLGTFRLKYDPRLLRAYDERNQWAMTMLYCWNSKLYPLLEQYLSLLLPPLSLPSRPSVPQLFLLLHQHLWNMADVYRVKKTHSLGFTRSDMMLVL